MKTTGPRFGERICRSCARGGLASRVLPLADGLAPSRWGARRRFVDYIHGQIRELLTNYGKIDALWCDVAWPLDAQGWESEEKNAMVFQLQPGIVVNNRNKLDGDFTTPEQDHHGLQPRMGILVWR